MDRSAEQHDVIRTEVRRLCDKYGNEYWRGLEPSTYPEEFVAELTAQGWLGALIPEEYGGGGLSLGGASVILEEIAASGGNPSACHAQMYVMGTVLRHGSEEQKRHYLPQVADGRKRLQAFGVTEPIAGTNTTAIRTRAVRDGDVWRIDGQKIWTSAGHLADHIFTLARTDPDGPKHKGISFMLVPMDQPGIEVRPIKMISGDSEFNEVFYTDARVPKDDIVGGLNNGWAVAMSLLGFERGEAAATAPIRFQAEIDRLTAMAQERGKADDPIIRQRLAACHAQVRIMRYNGMRVLTQFLKGHHPGPDAAIGKLFWSEYHKVVTELAIDILGADALDIQGRRPPSSFSTDDPGAANSSASWVNTFLNARAGTIYAGSSQIQRNIIGEMILGLPKEPKPA